MIDIPSMWARAVRDRTAEEKGFFDDLLKRWRADAKRKWKKLPWHKKIYQIISWWIWKLWQKFPYRITNKRKE